ncbi:histidine phosphatase superfamily [Mycena galericulata]|nr:histidine phosphatase superfamily [Mycena galericulata]
MSMKTRVIVFLALCPGMTWFLLANDWMLGRAFFFPTIHNYEPEFNLRKSWGAYSPFFSVEEYTPPPEGCEVTQVNIVSRLYSAGYVLKQATQSSSRGTARVSRQLARRIYRVRCTEVEGRRRIYAPGYGIHVFRSLTHWVRTISSHSALRNRVKPGLMYTDGMATYSMQIIFRSCAQSSGVRVVDSATNWTAGFAAASHYVYRPSLAVILAEEGNDTLESHMCPNAGSSDAQTDEWLAVYAPATTARLNSWAPGANLTDRETHALISLCAFHTAAHANPARLSPVCGLFTRSEFAGFDYAADLDKYYYTGYGGPLGRVQGVGYTNELLARLTRSPVCDGTQTNRTLDADPATFPLDRAVPREPDAHRTWHTHAMVPFSGRMVVEKLACGATDSEYVRILVNDALQPLEFCAADGIGVGMCTASQYARHNGGDDWGKCYTSEIM